MESIDTVAGAWTWFGREIAEFGVRWVIIAMFALGFGGWFGKRYRDMKREVAELRRAIEAQPAAAAQAGSSLTIHGGITITHSRFVDGRHLVGIEGKGEIVSPTPIYVQSLRAALSSGGPEAVAGAGATEERWRASPGAGRNAAEAIARAPTLDDARAIWAAYQSAPHRTDTNWAYWAFISRLEEAGHGEEVADLAFALTDSGEDIDLTEEIEATIKRWQDDGR